MKLLDIEIRGFGCLKDFRFSLEDGVNTVSFPDGGKTTFISFVKAVFCGFDNGTQNYLPSREKSVPWHSDAFGGVLRFTHGDTVYTADVSWGESPDGDVMYLTEGNSEPVAYASPDVLTEIIGIRKEDYAHLFTGAFFTDISDSIRRSVDAVCPSENDPLGHTCESTDSFNRALESIRAERKYIEGGEIPGALELLGELIESSENELRQTEEAESKVLGYSETISYNEKLLSKYDDEFTPDKAIEAVKTSSTITAKNERVRSLLERRITLEKDIEEEEKKQKKIKIPFIILTALLIFAVLLADAIALINPGSPAFLAGISSRMRGLMPDTAYVSGGLVIILAVILISICTKRSSRLKAYDEQLYRIYYSLCDTVNFGTFEPVDFDGLGDESENVLQEKIANLDSDAKSADNFIETTAKTFETIFRHEGEKTVIRDEITSARSAMNILAEQIASRTSYTDLLERNEELKEYYSRLESRLETLGKSEEILQKAAKRMKLSFIPELSGIAGSYLDRWTDGRYSAVTVSPSYGVCIYDGEFFRGIDCFGESVKYLASLAIQASVISMLASDGREYTLFIDSPSRIISPETLEKINGTLEFQTVIT